MRQFEQGPRSARRTIGNAAVRGSRRIAAILAAVVLAAACAVPRPAVAQAYGERSAVNEPQCLHACLIGFARRYMDALVHHDPSRVPFARDVRFTENDVELEIGQGVWGSISSAAPNALLAADPDTGNVVWLGTIEENGSPAYYAMRLKVRRGRIMQVETVVTRKTALPKPFGDPSKIVHDPAFQQIEAPAERRERERLRDVTNGYFSTVERNDGALLTVFDPDCQRMENGISTTSGHFGSAADAQGCTAQFLLGIFRINKRVRERRYPLIDVQRGVVVATGFFDHDNSFDTYKLTNGKVLHTLLKWPNSLSLMEAFKIRNGRIYRVEASFTYVPYAMHSPWEDRADAPAPPPLTRASASQASDCDRACLVGLADRYMSALAAHVPARLPWADAVRYTEDGIPLNVGDGEWGSVTARSSQALIAADPTTGNVAWFGVVEEHGDPAYYGVRLVVRGRKIAGIESVIDPKEDPAPFGHPAAYGHGTSFAALLPAAERRSRSQLLAAARRYYAALRSRESPRDVVREPSFHLVDVEHGIVVATTYIDHPALRKWASSYQTRGLDTPYPQSIGLIQALEVRAGAVARVETIGTLVPYSLPSPWAR
ncbi:MAG: hypothetical protein ACRETB_01870 [Steroidobacteraceae bacterium]